MAIKLANAYVQIIPSAEGIQGRITEIMGGEASRAGDSAGALLGSRLVKSATKILSGAAIGKALAETISSGAALEQSIGGIETLFKDSADAVKAAAADAYKTAGLSANEYMEQTTSFAASLLQSLGNDTRAAATVSQMAMEDMSDNANKMGTDMVSIQNAYQGFAKQNYTMLDNLKLGYGGTKTEMERLLADAEAFSGVHYDISSLADVYNAIHVIQEELDITGTTAKEAETTLSGSFNSMKAAASNVLGNLALGEDLTPSLETLSETAKTYLVGNFLPAISNVLQGIPQAVYTLVPEILQSGTDLMQSLASGFLEGIPEFLSSALPALLQFTENLRANAGDFVTAGIDLILNLANGIVEGLPQLFAHIPDIVINIAGLINDNAPKLLAGGVMLIAKLGEGILKSATLIPQHISKILESVISVISAVNWVSLGANILTGIGNGIKSMASGLLNAFKSGFSSGIQWILSLPKQAFQWGKNLIQSFIDGLSGKSMSATASTYEFFASADYTANHKKGQSEWSLSDDVVDKAEVNAFKMQNLAKSTESVMTTAASNTASATAASASETAQATKTITESVISSQTDAATSYSQNSLGRVMTATSELTEKILKSDGTSYDRFTKTVTESGKELVNGVVKNYKTITKTVTGEGGKVTSTTEKVYEDASKTLTETLTNTAQTLVNGISTTVEAVTQKFADGSSQLVQTTTETGERLVNGALETYTKIKKIAEDGTETTSETSQAVVSEYDTLNSAYGAASKRVAELTALYNESVAATGDFSYQSKNLAGMLNEAEEKLDSAKSALKEYEKTTNRAYVQTKKFTDLIKQTNSGFSDFGSSISALGEFFDSETIQNAGDFFTTITDGVDKVINLATSTATLVTTLQELKTTLQTINTTGGVSGMVSGIGKLLGIGSGTAAAGTASYGSGIVASLMAGSAETGAATAAAGAAGAAATTSTAAAGTAGVAALGLSIPQIGLIVAGVLGVAAVGYGIYKWATKDKDKTKKDDKLSYKNLQDAYWYGNERAFAGYDYRTDPYTFRSDTAQAPLRDYQNKVQEQLGQLFEVVEKYLPQAGNGVLAVDGEELGRIVTPSVNANLGQLTILSGRGN